MAKITVTINQRKTFQLIGKLGKLVLAEKMDMSYGAFQNRFENNSFKIGHRNLIDKIYDEEFEHSGDDCKASK